MKTLKDLLEETFRAGFNAATGGQEEDEVRKVKDAAWANHLERPQLQKILAGVVLGPLSIRCSMHGDQAPVAACKPCLDHMQAFVNARAAEYQIARGVGQKPPPVGQAPVLQPGAVDAAMKLAAMPGAPVAASLKLPGGGPATL